MPETRGLSRRFGVERVGPGETIEPSSMRPGDFLLTHRSAWPSRAIAFGQRLRFRGDQRPYAHWTHAACVVGSGRLVEALGAGVAKTSIDRYRDVEYHYVRVDATLWDRMQMRRFALACVGDRYGWLEIVSLFFTLAFGTRLNLGVDGQTICSGLVARMLERGDAIFDREPQRIMPADLARYFKVRPELGLHTSALQTSGVSRVSRREVRS